MRAAADGQVNILLPGEPDGVDDVGHVDAPRDDLRGPVDHRVEDGSGSLVVGVSRPDNGAPQGRVEPLKGGPLEDGCSLTGHGFPPSVSPVSRAGRPVTEIRGEARGRPITVDAPPTAGTERVRGLKPVSATTA